MRTTWSGPEAVRAVAQRRWNSGELLRSHAVGDPLVPIRVSLKGPRAAEVADQLARIEAWINRLEKGAKDGACYELEWKQIGGRRFQRERLPSHAVVSRLPQAWRLLGVQAEVERFDAVLAVVGQHPTVRDWVVEHPLRALRIDDWPRLLATFSWLDAHRGSGRHLREMSAPGVDTKFAEQHRGVLAELLRVRGSATGFLADLGLGRRPELVRMRLGVGVALLGLSEVAVRAEELTQLDVAAGRALIVENEITYLSVPVPPDGVVLWGRGFDVDRVGRLPWLMDAEVTYWGDIDTHGFAILNRLRGRLPRVRSVLMDHETLLEHRDRWVHEAHPTAAVLPRLTPAEARLHQELVEDRFGPGIRLEQELISWPWVLERLG